jgi:hypothetical protein
MMTKLFRGFPQSRQPNAMTVPRLGHDSVISNASQSITNLSPHHSTLYSYGLETKIATLNKMEYSVGTLLIILPIGTYKEARA